eukprot:maker-scaffold377_size191454-snap-gene-0.29 protein:Tk05669 transcript:maker-scaffold377_size191454-snap-gene-0.29-mRNA-1 annotation:"cathepsin f-like cysteine peptidase protein"
MPANLTQTAAPDNGGNACLMGLVLSGAWAQVLVGAPAPQEELEPRIRDFALQHLAMGDNSLYHKKAIKVTDVTTQVVAGIKHSFSLHLVETDCLKSTGLSVSEDCDAKEDAPVKVCRVTVWEKSWENFMKVTDVDCEAETPNGGSGGESEEEAQVEVNRQADPHSVSKKILEDKTEPMRVGKNMKELLSSTASRFALRRLQRYGNFKKFVKTFQRTYKTRAELHQRYLVFKDNMKKVQFLRETEQATGVYGVTKFADFTEEEFKEHRLGFNPNFQSVQLSEPADYSDLDDVELPLKFDWRDHGAVTPVKSQGSCGSCWAFSVTGNIEGQWAIHRGKLISLSEQELVDCDRLDNGCNGGLPSNAYQAIMKLGGLEAEEDYVYDGRDDKCRFDKNKVRVTIDSAVNLTQNEDTLAKWLVKNGPISIGINANAMQFYMGGISHPWSFLCHKESLDHGVLIVGFGMDEFKLFKEKLPYWTVKNSWGTDWGEQGYYRVYRGDSTCGVNQMATSAIVKG